MEFTAKLNYVRVSPQKARLVLGLIKGRRVEEALDTLQFNKKRIRPAPMGRAYRYQRRISHIEIALAEKVSGNGHKADLVQKVEADAPAKGAAKKTAAKKAPAKKSAAKKAPAKKFAGKKQPAKKK